MRKGRDGHGESQILKILRPPAVDSGAGTSAWPTSEAPDHFNFWRREVAAYESGFANSAFADAGIRAPSVIAVDARADGSIELWLEDVEGHSGFDLSTERLGRFAYELAAGQARWVERVPPPDELPWLSRRWLAQYVSGGPHSKVLIDDTDWDTSIAQVWPTKTRLSLRRLWESRASVLAAAEAFPRTLCHLDLWPANLIEDTTGTSVLIDWAFVGEGAIGEDPSNLIIDSVTDGLMDIAQLPDIAEAISDGYIAGLSDAGSHSSANEIRTAIATCGAAKYSWLAALAIASAASGTTGGQSSDEDDAAAESLERITPLAELLAQWADTTMR
ncbi:phosphotransferase [Catenulispora acidiphila]|uniref:phosphotransferase n=1 Tax=Catenulispora acidiphila TaxID=304895 RepID=UPI00167FDFBE|nr:phosphotransferase [Catenulispora acidiphila]